MVLIKDISAWIGGHDVKLWQNQVAYTEDLQIWDSEKVILWLKSTNVITTSNNLAMSFFQFGSRTFIGCENGKIYNNSWVEILDTWNSRAIINIVRTNDNDLYFSDLEDLWSIDYFDTSSSTDWSAESSYNYPIWSQNGMFCYLLDWNNVVFWTASKFKRAVSPASLIDLTDPVWTPIWVRKTTNYFNLFSDDWEHYYSNAVSSLASALNILEWDYKKAFYKEWLQAIITSWKPENSKLFAIWENKQLLAAARLATPDNKKAFHFWRSFTDYLSDDWMAWNDCVTSANNYIYFVWENGVISFGADDQNHSKWWNVVTTKNYLNDTVDDIGFVKPILQDDGTIRLYYSWRVGSTCWVDYIDLNWSTYKDNWVFYSQKFSPNDTDAGQKYKIQRIKARANTYTDASIDIYVSKDGGAFESVWTLSNTNQKQAHLINKHYECHEIQWKFVLSTTDNTKTPEFRSFSFSMERIDG